MKQKKKKPLLFRALKSLLRLFYPKIEIIGKENIPNESIVIVGNHSQMHGPIACELYFPDNYYTWCAGQMMHLRDVPKYAYKDFWSQKPGYIRWFFKIVSYLIAPLSVLVFNNARTIAVYRDTRVIKTFRESMAKLQNGNSVIIFPEYDKKHNNIIYDFQDKFIDMARFYYKRTGKELYFVPLYIAPKLKKMCLGTPIRFNAENSSEEERKGICEYLMSEITEMARSLPKHTVVPYRNIPKKYYPTNISEEVVK